MKHWDLPALALQAHSPEILSTTDDARAILLEIPAGETLSDHQVHERAWVTVIDGQVEVTTAGGEQVQGGPGLLLEFAPAERHAVRALTRTRLLLVLTPWPGEGHPGAMTIEEKAHVRERAAQARAAGGD